MFDKLKSTRAERRDKIPKSMGESNGRRRGGVYMYICIFPSTNVFVST